MPCVRLSAAGVRVRLSVVGIATLAVAMSMHIYESVKLSINQSNAMHHYNEIL